MGGVLHDLGVLLLASHFPQPYERVSEMVLAEGIGISIAEQWEFGVTHAEVGAYLLGLWGIPASILNIISLHHSPGRAPCSAFTPLLAVHLADVFSGTHPLFATSKLDTRLLDALGFTPRLEEWRSAVAETSLD